MQIKSKSNSSIEKNNFFQKKYTSKKSQTEQITQFVAPKNKSG
jgi:hypothetical protein